MENGGPTDSLKVQRSTFLKELSAYNIDPYEDTGGVSYTMYSIGVMREPIGKGSIPIKALRLSGAGSASCMHYPA